MEKNNQSVDIKSLSKEQRAALMAQLQQEEKEDRIARRETYEALRGEFMHEVKTNVLEMVNAVTGFRGWLEKEADAFTKVMKEYGQVKSDEQRSYTITDGDFRLEVKSNKVKGFDERADMAADRLIDYLKRYMQNSEKGSDDPMYQMAMTLLERNKMGDLDYKSISKLYELEDKFDEEYADIMRLFKEANVVQRNATNYYSVIFVREIKCMGKGRDKELIKLRDEALCRRYYYWTEIQRLRFDDALKVLSEREFFISEERIMTIIRRKSREGTDYNLKPVPKVKAPRLTAAQLELFPIR